jgi:hypothetical protein
MQVPPHASADEQSDQAPASAHSHDIADMSRECAAQAAIDRDGESESEESEVSGDEEGATVEQAVSGGAQRVSGSSLWARLASAYPQGLRVGASVFPCSPRRQLWSNAALMFHPDVLATRVSRPGLCWSECRPECRDYAGQGGIGGGGGAECDAGRVSHVCLVL